MRKLVVFHPALAPYRLDFFNSLNEEFDASFYFLHPDALEQSFDQQELKQNLSFTPHYLSSVPGALRNARPEVFSILRKEKPDIVFCSEYNILGVFILFYKALFQPTLKVLTICDDNVTMARNVSTLKKRVRDFMIRRLDGVILANREVMQWYRETYPDKNFFFYFPIIQRDSRFRWQLQAALPLSRSLSHIHQLEQRQILLYVGRMTAVKNVYLLIDAFRKVKEHFPSVLFFLVGEGDQLNEIKEYVVSLKLQKSVIFVGKKQGNELFAYYNLGQIFVLPSKYEPFGAVVNEALLAGCYTLCSTAAGSSDLIREGENGSLFSPDSPVELASKLEEILRHTSPYEKADVKPNRMMKSYTEYITHLMTQIKQIV